MKDDVCTNLAGFCNVVSDCSFGLVRFEILRDVDDDDVLCNGLDQFRFGGSHRPDPRLLQLENGKLATAAGIAR